MLVNEAMTNPLNRTGAEAVTVNVDILWIRPLGVTPKRYEEMDCTGGVLAFTRLDDSTQCIATVESCSPRVHALPANTIGSTFVLDIRAEYDALALDG